MVNILVVVFILLLIISLAPKNKKFVPYLYIFLGIILFFVAAFRIPGVDRDYYNYIVLYEGIRTDIGIEISFLLISSVIKVVVDNVLYLFIVYALLGVYFKLAGIKLLTPFVLFSLLLYFSNFYFLHELTQIRVGVAAGFLLFSVKYIVDKNLKKFLIVSLIAILFHYSALIILPLWFLNNKMQKLFYYLIPIGVLFYIINFNFIFKIPIPIVQERILAYEKMVSSGDETEINVFNLLFILRCILFYIMMFLHQSIAKHNLYFTVLLKIYGISLFVFPAFAGLSVMSFRINEFYGIVEIVLIPFIIYLRKDLGIFLVVLLALILFVYNIFIAELIL